MNASPVAILGAGSVGATLARSLAVAGRAVTIGTRDPAAVSIVELVAELGPACGAALPADAITANPTVIVALPGGAVRAVIDANTSALAGKLVVDASNNLAGGHVPGSMSALPWLAEAVPTAAGYRAFNSIGAENMAEPRFGDTTADLFYAGPDTDGRPEIESLISDVGFRPVFVGDGPDAMVAVDALTTLWFSLAFGQGRGRRLAFRLLGADD